MLMSVERVSIPWQSKNARRLIQQDSVPDAGGRAATKARTHTHTHWYSAHLPGDRLRPGWGNDALSQAADMSVLVPYPSTRLCLCMGRASF